MVDVVLTMGKLNDSNKAMSKSDVNCSGPRNLISRAAPAM